MIQKTTPKDNQRLCYSLNLDSVDFGSTDYRRAIAHELGHYVFWLGDEYQDKNGKDYEDYTICYYVANTIVCYPDENLTKKVPAAVMNNEYKFSELSTFKEYKEFHTYLENKYGAWEPYTTAQWGLNGEPSWKTLQKLLLNGKVFSWRFKDWVVKVEVPSLLQECPLVSEDFVPKTGPYTGVGYFMGVVWE